MLDKVKVVVIDSGLNGDDDQLKKYILHSIEMKEDKGGKIQLMTEFQCTHIHGTVIANCIRSVCDEVQFIDISILNSKLMSSSKLLIAALKYCMKFSPNVVNLSLGTVKKIHFIKLKRIINELNNRNIIVICSVDNENKKTYPASFKNVIGVKSSTNLAETQIKYIDKYFYTSGIYSYDNNERKETYEGNSIATAYVTGSVCKLIQKSNIKLDINDIKDIMKN
ncbi:S8 family serine peptidase [Clostridium sp. 19966]|uniref:S8 family serine peptidase n=1 Tax=Clostridium sp. 19966 TaxID=2768166 RepID=UPI0028DDC970|nr:S8 family serine peptidase [Clostridium sp. 19966]MDT8719430.1 S8 family serine peptidase [Clostridium sp. 19966]